MTQAEVERAERSSGHPADRPTATVRPGGQMPVDVGDHVAGEVGLQLWAAGGVQALPVLAVGRSGGVHRDNDHRLRGAIGLQGVQRLRRAPADHPVAGTPGGVPVNEVDDRVAGSGAGLLGVSGRQVDVGEADGHAQSRIGDRHLHERSRAGHHAGAGVRGRRRHCSRRCGYGRRCVSAPVAPGCGGAPARLRGHPARSRHRRRRTAP